MAYMYLIPLNKKYFVFGNSVFVDDLGRNTWE